MKLTVQCSEESGIPEGSLPKWYEKFGFTKSPSYNQKNRDMIYTPKKK